MIYADNAATTKMSKKAMETFIDCTNNYYGNASSLYTFGQKAKEVLEEARERIANQIGADPKEIYFVSGGSEADNQAIISAARIGAKKEKKHIISSKFEHHAVLNTLKELEKEGFEITLLDVHENGIINLDELKSAIRKETCLVTIMFANNEIGTIQPIKEIGEICRENDIMFHTDAVQAAGHLSIDVKEQNVDLLSMSAHKFNGPKGIGVLYAKKGIRLTSLINGGNQEKGKRAGTENPAAAMAMAVALEESYENREEKNIKIKELRNRIIGGLNEISYSKLNGDITNRLPNNINFCFEGIEGESLLLLLDDKGIAASSGSACTSGSLEPSHVLLAIGRPHEVAHGSLRLTINEELTEKEADILVQSTRDVVEYLRNMSPFWRDLESGKREHIFSK